MKILIILLSICLIVWIAWSYLSIKNIEEPKYKVLSQNEFFEIREYEPFITAETTVDAEFREGLNEGFRRIANYIFGGNKKSEPIAMTAPVAEKSVSNETESEKIAMTVPVSERQISDNKIKVWFIMPSKYKLEDLPEPLDNRVELKEVPSYKVAVHKFGAPINAERIKKKKKALKDKLKSENIDILSEPIFAGYNPPFSFPLFVRNEVMIEIK